MLEDIYKSSTVAAAIKAKKEQNPSLWKPHPEVPALKEAVLYKCWLNEQEADKLKKRHTKELAMSAEIEEEAAGRLFQHHATHVGTGSGSSSVVQTPDTDKVLKRAELIGLRSKSDHLKYGVANRWTAKRVARFSM